MVASAATLTAVLAASAAAVPPRKPRRVVSIGVFVGGVLCTRSAWVIWIPSFWLGLEPGRKLALPLGLDFMLSIKL